MRWLILLLGSNGVDRRPRKRPRLNTQKQTADVDSDITDLWWQAVQSNALIANGVPNIRFASSRQSISKTPRTSLQSPTKAKSKKRKRSKKSTASSQSLLSIMNNNMRTLRRVRHTHAKFAALNANTSNEDGDGYFPPPEGLGEEVNEVVDEQPWIPRGSGTELGSENAASCMHWMSRKVLEHSGFQGLCLCCIYTHCPVPDLQCIPCQDRPRWHLMCSLGSHLNIY